MSRVRSRVNEDSSEEQSKDSSDSEHNESDDSDSDRPDGRVSHMQGAWKGRR